MTVTTEVPMDVDDVKSLPLFETFSVLKNIKEAQQKHGLRHGDYNRYRIYCGHRIRRIRKKLNFTHNYKSIKKTKSKWQEKEVTKDVVTDLGFVEIVMFDAERDWAYAQHLKHEMGDNTLSRKKFHMRRKLKNAVYHSGVLEKIVKKNDRFDAVSKLEVQAYHNYFNGILNFELQRWKLASDYFCTVKTIYEKLASVVKFPDMVQLYNSRCREVQPLLRICEYNLDDNSSGVSDMMRLKINGSSEVSKELDKLIDELQVKSIGDMESSVTWATFTTPVAQIKIRQLVLQEKKLKEEIEGYELFEEKLGVYEKFLQNLREELGKLIDEKRKVPPSVAEDLRNPLVITIHYLEFLKYKISSERYLLMINNMKFGNMSRTVKPQDFLRLYSSIIQNSYDIISIQGADEDKNITDAFSFKAQFYQAFKTFYMSQVYFQMNKTSESEALLMRSEERLKNLTKSLSSLRENQYVSERQNELDELQTLIDEARVTNKASLFSSALDISEDNNYKIPSGYINENPEKLYLFDTSEIEESSKNESGLPIVNFGVELQPMPAKPMFFDLALNHIKVDDRLKRKYPDIFKN
uniref:Signal recognition particle subunit SRP68 n=1 Tax=Parastrongyloides trichosuri TaxID=131310 RepID=A0A0N4ZA52_PARTI